MTNRLELKFEFVCSQEVRYFERMEQVAEPAVREWSARGE